MNKLEEILYEDILSIPEALVLLTHYNAELITEFHPPVLTMYYEYHTYFYRLNTVYNKEYGHFYFEKILELNMRGYVEIG